MITGTVQIRDTATPRLHSIRSRVRRPAALMAVAGKRVEKELRAHFAEKNAQGNKKGFPRSNFWSKTVRAATSFTGATDNSAEVTIASPEFVHKLKGGTIRARRSRFLAIPLTARAKAAGSPREGGWKGGTLKFYRTRGGRAILVEARYTALRRARGRLTGTERGGDGIAHYLLVRSVRHRPDPTALPTDRDMQAAVDDEAEKYFKRERLQGGQS